MSRPYRVACIETDCMFAALDKKNGHCEGCEPRFKYLKLIEDQLHFGMPAIFNPEELCKQLSADDIDIDALEDISTASNRYV